MVNKIKRLADSELEIMLIIWHAQDSVTSAYISENLTKKLARTSILTFLSRLVEKGFLRIDRQSKINVYTPLINKKIYLESEGKSVLKKLYDNSIKTLVVSLYDGKAISDQDLEELKAFINSKTKEE